MVFWPLLHVYWVNHWKYQNIYSTMSSKIVWVMVFSLWFFTKSSQKLSKKKAEFKIFLVAATKIYKILWLSSLFSHLFQNGEIDCWPIECPPTFCSHPILRPGHCCPSCGNKDGLLRSSCHNSGLGEASEAAAAASSCLHLGTEYKSGQSWAPFIDSASNNCTQCNCRVYIKKNSIYAWAFVKPSFSA